MTDVVALAAELLAINSTTGSEGEVVEFVSRWLLARGWNVELQEAVQAGAAGFPGHWPPGAWGSGPASFWSR